MFEEKLPVSNTASFPENVLIGGGGIPALEEAARLVLTLALQTNVVSVGGTVEKNIMLAVVLHPVDQPDCSESLATRGQRDVPAVLVSLQEQAPHAAQQPHVRPVREQLNAHSSWCLKRTAASEGPWRDDLSTSIRENKPLSSCGTKTGNVLRRR